MPVRSAEPRSAIPAACLAIWPVRSSVRAMCNCGGDGCAVRLAHLQPASGCPQAPAGLPPGHRGCRCCRTPAVAPSRLRSAAAAIISHAAMRAAGRQAAHRVCVEELDGVDVVAVAELVQLDCADGRHSICPVGCDHRVRGACVVCAARAVQLALESAEPAGHLPGSTCAAAEQRWLQLCWGCPPQKPLEIRNTGQDGPEKPLPRVQMEPVVAIRSLGVHSAGQRSKSVSEAVPRAGSKAEMDGRQADRCRTRSAAGSLP
jgi:hypothetical protein